MASNDSQAKLDTEWKFTRTKLWLGWIYKKDVLPPPYNVLYVLLPVCWVVKRLASACCPEIVRVSTTPTEIVFVFYF